MRLIVVVDDERTFDTDEEIIYLRTVDEAISWIAQWWTTNQNRPYMASARWIDELWFDHDLGESGDAITVANFIRALSEVNGDVFPIHTINVHSQNPVGADNIVSATAGCAELINRTGLPRLK